MNFPILAHQGGWDEALLFAVPIVIALLAVRWAERRAKRRKGSAEDHDDSAPPT